MYPTKPFDIDFAIATVETIYKRHVLNAVNPEIRNEILMLLGETLTRVTPQLITSTEHLYNTLWTAIRRDYSQVSINFLLSATSEMMMRFKSKRWDAAVVAQFFIDTVPVMATDVTAMDSPLKEQLLVAETQGEIADVASMFEHNHWYIFVVIFTMTNFAREVEEAAAERGKGKAK